MNDINLNIPYARIIPEKTIKKFTTKLLDYGTNEFSLNSGDFLDNRYEIVESLPNIGPLKCYTALDHKNTSRCGTCGTVNGSDQIVFCERCGYQIPGSRFLLLEGDEAQTRVFELLVAKRLYYEGVFRFFDMFSQNKRNYIIAQNRHNKKLSDIVSNVLFYQAMNWTLSLLTAVIFLHHHNVFNVDLSPEGIFIFPGGPKLLNFTNALVTSKNVGRWIKSDIKNLAKTLLQLQSKIEPGEENMLYMKSIFMNAVQGGYHRMRDFFDDVIELDENLKQLDRLSSDKKTVFLTDKGVSISIGMASDVGMVRNLNEDSVSALELTNIIQSVSIPYGLYMVADGMGGHDAGEEASKLAVEYITRKIIDSFNGAFELSEDEIRQILEDAVFSANREINKVARLKNNNMGTTITIAYTSNNQAFILNVGDARAYWYSNNKLKLITQDHSLVYRLYKIGQLTYPEIYQHPQNNQILCSLGEPNLQQSLANLAEKANHPYYFNISLERGDGLLLCTDGLWQMLQDQQIEEVLNHNLQPQNAVDELVNLANHNGGDDNISLIYVKTQ